MLVEGLEGRTLLAAPDAITISAADALSFAGSADNNKVTVSYDPGTATYTINDSVDVINVTNNGSATTSGDGTNTVTISGINALAIDGGAGTDTINIESIGDPTTLDDTAGGDETYKVGDPAAGVQGIAAPLSLVQATGTADFTVDDSANTAPETGVEVTASKVTGLAPATINYAGTALSYLTLDGGSGGNTITITGTPNNAPVDLESGNGNDTVNVYATNGGSHAGLFIDGDNGTDTVTIGDANYGDPHAGVQDIAGDVVVTNSGGLTDLTVDDSLDEATKSDVYFDDGILTGLAPATISYFAADINSLTVNGGDGGNTYTVGNTIVGSVTTLNTGAGNNTVSLQASQKNSEVDINGQGGSDSVTLGNVGSGLQGFDGSEVISNAGGHTALTVDDRADPNSVPATLSASGGVATLGNTLTPHTISYTVSEITQLKLLSGKGSNSLSIDFGGGNPIPTSLAPGIEVQASSGSDTINLAGGTFTNESFTANGTGSGSINLDGNLVGFSGLETVHDVTPAASLTVAEASGTVTIGNGPMFGGVQTAAVASPDVAPSGVTTLDFAHKAAVTINATGAPGGAGGQAILDLTTPSAGLTGLTVNAAGTNVGVNVTATPPGIPTSANAVSGNDSVDVKAQGLNAAPGSHFATAGGPASDTLNVDASGETTVDSSTVGTVAFGAGASPITYTSFAQVNIAGAPGVSPSGSPSPTTLRATEGQALVAAEVDSFTSPASGASASDFLATIDWGDGTSGVGTITEDAQSPPVFHVTGTHTFARAGVDAVKVTVKDLGETSTEVLGSTRVSTARVAGAPMTFVPAGSAAVADAPLSASPRAVAATSGVALPSGTVLATFTDADPAGTVGNYSGSISWGDGSTSPFTSANVIAIGTPPGGQTFEVVAGPSLTHTYAQAATLPLSVTISDVGGSVALASGTVAITALPSPPASIAVVPTTGPASTEGQPFSGTVASFTDANTADPASVFAATIDWGDGTPSSTGAVVANPGGSGFLVTGAHTYAGTGASGTFTVTTAISGPGGGKATATTAITVAVPTATVAGQLSPASDSGASSGDAVTHVIQPQFSGTSAPGTTVVLIAQPSGGGPVIIGQATTAGDGLWSLTTIPLSNGRFVITAEAEDGAGHVEGTAQLLPNASQGPLVVDTVAPTVTALHVDKALGQVDVSFQDALSGLDLATLVNTANYSVTRQGAGPAPLVAFATLAPGGAPGNETVVLSLNLGRRSRGGSYTLTVKASNGIQDLAGNALDGSSYGSFPSGSGHPGSDFVAKLGSLRTKGHAPKAKAASKSPFAALLGTGKHGA